LPAELRNQIYEECLKDSNDGPDGEYEGLWLRAKRRSHRRSVQRMVPDAPDYLGYEAYERRWHHRRHNQNSNSSIWSLKKPATPKQLATPLLSVCKQIYSEAASMLYSQRIVFAETSALVSFLAQLTPRCAQMLRHLEIRCWTSTRARKSMGYLAMVLLASKGAFNLETIDLHCSLGYFTDVSYFHQRKSKPVALQLAGKVYRDCYPWLEAMGSHKLAIDEGNMDDMYAGIEIIKVHDMNFKNYNNRDDGEEVGEEKKRMYRKEMRKLVRCSW
jgi:hypothetical protein